MKLVFCFGYIYFTKVYTICMVSNHLSSPRLQSDSSSFATFFAWCRVIKYKCKHHKHQYIVKTVLRDHTGDQKMWSLKTGGLLTQVNYTEKKVLWWAWKGGLLTQLVLRTESTVLYIALAAYWRSCVDKP